MKRIQTPIFFMLLLATTFIQRTIQFHKMGHMIVARIAELEIENTRIHKQILDILSILTQYTKEQDYMFIEAAPWADDIKAVGVKSMSKWHFSDNYINGNRVLTKKELTEHKITENPENLVWATNQAKTVLRNKHTSLIDDRMNKSIYMRLLIHFYGDLHQPLHNVSFVDDKDFKKGDAGGNAFKIDLPGARDLHTLWDKCVKKCKEVVLPLSKEDFDLIDSYAKDLMKKYPRSQKWVKERLEVVSVKEISLESIPMAIDYVYKGIQFNKKPTQSYLEEGGNLIDKQLLIGGYRLSDSLQILFEDEEVLKPHLKPKKKQFENGVQANFV